MPPDPTLYAEWARRLEKLESAQAVTHSEIWGNGSPGLSLRERLLRVEDAIVRARRIQLTILLLVVGPAVNLMWSWIIEVAHHVGSK